MDTIQDAIRQQDPRTVVPHDGNSDHRVCDTCLRSLGPHNDGYAPEGIAIPKNHDWTKCPDARCGGAIGMRAIAHPAWKWTEQPA